MPKKLERKLKKQAKKLGLGKKRTGAYVYGTLGKMGSLPQGRLGAHLPSNMKMINGSMVKHGTRSIRNWGP